MKILDQVHLFALVDGKIGFSRTKVLFSEHGNTFLAKSSQQQVPDDISKAAFDSITLIDPVSYRPPLPAGTTVVSHYDAYFVKRPNLISSGAGTDLAALVLQELATCETIRKFPHQNLATYHGCLVSDRRVTGLCFTRYPDTLLNKLNPHSLNKAEFILSGNRAAAATAAVRYLPGIEAGIRHLHSLNIVHNDLNPANIAITEDDIPVIIDFDSCSAPGASLDRTKRTHSWFDREDKVAEKRSDIKALSEIRIWLTGSSPDDFQFKEV